MKVNKVTKILIQSKIGELARALGEMETARSSGDLDALKVLIEEAGNSFLALSTSVSRALDIDIQ